MLKFASIIRIKSQLNQVTTRKFHMNTKKIEGTKATKKNPWNSSGPFKVFIGELDKGFVPGRRRWKERMALFD